MDVNKLVAFIRSHDMRAWAENGKLFAISEWYDSRGEYGENVEEIKPTLSAVRDWLNY